MLIDLIITGGSAGGFRNQDVENYSALDPPFLEEMMREGLSEEDDLPLPGKCFEKE